MSEVVKRVIDTLFEEETTQGDPLLLRDILAMDQRARSVAADVIKKI
jgi:hypothetical protein